MLTEFRSVRDVWEKLPTEADARRFLEDISGTMAGSARVTTTAEGPPDHGLRRMVTPFFTAATAWM
jgi:hypothetical protein